MEENSKLEAMLGAAREEVTGQGRGGRGVPSQAYLHPLVLGPALAPAQTQPDPGLLSPCQILHLRHQVSLRDDLLQLYSDSDDDDEEEEEEREEDKEEKEEEEEGREEGEEEEEEEVEEQQHDHPYEAPER